MELIGKKMDAPMDREAAALGIANEVSVNINYQKATLQHYPVLAAPPRKPA